MEQKGFSYIELSIASAIFIVSALGLLSLVSSLTTSVQELRIINQIREQAKSKLVETLLGFEISPPLADATTHREKKPSELTKDVENKQSKLSKITITSNQEGKDFVISYTINITLLPSPPSPVDSIHQQNLAHKPE